MKYQQPSSPQPVQDQTEKNNQLYRLHVATPTTKAGTLNGLPAIDWSSIGAEKYQPKPQDAPKDWHPYNPLPKADIVVMTWTKAEWAALDQVFCDYQKPMSFEDANKGYWDEDWAQYAREYFTIHQAMVDTQYTKQGGVPSLYYQAWGSFKLVTVGKSTVLLIKSDMHLAQDGTDLPLRQFVEQICDEAKPELLLSIGTAGGVRTEDALGCALVTNQAYFYLLEDFKNASFNNTTVKSSWVPKTDFIADAQKLVLQVPGYEVMPPSPQYPSGATIEPDQPASQIKIVTDQPIITTDSFMYGTTTNDLHEHGCIVEMDDAVVGMAAAQSKTPFGFIRNVSDPVINGHMPYDLQNSWAEYIYQERGLYTSFNGALAAWAVIAAQS